MNLNKLAEKDAAAWAAAQMFFGEGAGTRRKLLSAEISDKQALIPGYYDLFDKAYEKQNMGEHALKAVKERKHLDRAAKVSKNFRAIVRGDHRGLSTGVFVVVAIGYVAHQTGYDQKILAESKKYYRKVRAEIAVRKLRREWDKKTDEKNAAQSKEN